MRAVFLLSALAVAAPAPAAPADMPAPPTLLRCEPIESQTVSVSHDAAGTPLGVSLYTFSGTHECDLSTQGAPAVQSDGSWLFRWKYPLGDSEFMNVTVRRVGADGYAVKFDPPGCGTIAVRPVPPLSPKGKGCRVSVDRDGAFVQFWRQLRDALERNDGELLQRLSLPQPEFVEGPDVMKAPSSIMRNAARCLPHITATTQRLEIKDMIAGDQPPRLDMPPLSRKGDSRIDFAGAMSLTWTPQGWRMDGFNASRSVFSKCAAR